MACDFPPENNPQAIIAARQESPPGCPPFTTSGRDVRICLLDSGVPDHKAIVNVAGDINFTGSADNKDHVGHSTLISGLICGNLQGQIRGVAPDAMLYYAKMIDDQCQSRADSLVAGILWGIIKEVNIIAIPLCTDIDSPAVHDAIKKAYYENICVVASAGGDNQFYPAKYEEVLSVGALDQDGKIASFSAKGAFNILGRMVATTYIDQSFAIATGTSIATAFAVGIAAKAIEQLRHENIEPTPAIVYDYMARCSPHIVKP